MNVREEIYTDCLPPPALWNEPERERSRPRCSIAPGLTVMNGALNVSKHFISASSVFIRQDQPLAWTERSSTPRTAEGKVKVETLCFFRHSQLLFWTPRVKSHDPAAIMNSGRLWDQRGRLRAIWGYSNGILMQHNQCRNLG